ncbi:LuxR C-terminal-related transcriptional regulator [Flindersiella endophytica]
MQAGLDGTFGGEVTPLGDSYVIDRISGERMTVLDGLEIKAGFGLGGRALLLGKPTGVTDYQAAPSITHDFDIPVARAGLRAVFAIPVLLDGRPRAMLYAALRRPVPVSDRQLDIMHRLVSQYRFELRVDDEVARTVDDLGAQLLEAEAARMRDRLREIHAEIAALASQVDDPELRGRIVALTDRVRVPAAGRPAATPAMTPRELDVITQVAARLSNSDVAARIGLTPATVKSYLKSAMRRASVHNRMALVSSCRRAGLIP